MTVEQRIDRPMTFLAAFRHPTLAEYARLGLVATVGAGFLFSLAVALQIGWQEGLLCAVATVALVTASMPMLARRQSSLVEPIWLVILLVAVGVTGKAFYVCLGPEERVAFLLLGKQPRDLLFAALVIAAGMLALSAGYLLGNLRWRLPQPEWPAGARWDRRRFVAVVGALLTLGLLSFVLFSGQFDVSFETMSDLSSKRYIEVEGSAARGALGYLRWGTLLVEIAFYLVLVRWAASGKRLLSGFGTLVLAVGLAAAVYPIFVNSRLTIMLMVVRAVVIWICVRGLPRPRSVAILAALGLVLIGTMLAFRRGASDWQGIRREVSVAGLLEATVGGRHFLDLSKTAHVLDAVPEEIGFQHGRTFFTWLLAPVPREIWPEKPPLGFSQTLGPLLFRLPEGVGVPPGFTAELYLNFGLAGVFVGLLALGLLLRSLYATLRPRFSSPAAVLVYSLLSTRLGLGLLSNELSPSVTRLLMEMLPMAVVLHLLARRPTAGERTVPPSPAAGPRSG